MFRRATALSLAIALTACQPAGKDSAAILDSASGQDDSGSVQVEMGPEIPTVAHLSWDVATQGGIAAMEAQVSYWNSFTDTQTVTAQIEDNGDGTATCSATLLGLAASSTYYFEADVHLDATRLFNASGTISTDPPPQDLRLIAVDDAQPGTWQDGFLVSSWITSPPAVFMTDRQGNYVWWYIESDEIPDMVVNTAVFSNDGTSILYAIYKGAFSEVQNDESLEDAMIVRMSLDGRERETYDTPYLHHDFTELPDGSLAWLVFDFAEVDGTEYSGDAIMELSPGSDEPVQVWSTWDVPQVAEYCLSNSHLWSHANFLEYEPDQDAYYVSLHALDAILKVDRGSGQTQWILGGVASDFAIPQEDMFEWEHGFQVLDGESGILVFDDRDPRNASDLGEVVISRAVELELDTTEMTAHAVWEYLPDPALLTFCFGDVTRFTSGNTLVNFGCSGQIDEVNPDGELLWRLGALAGGALGYHDFREDLYSP